MQVLKAEEGYRFSEEYQAKYTACGDDYEQYKAVTLELQRRALADCGIYDPESLDVLHNMRHDFANDEEVLNLVVYHRTDTCFFTPTTPHDEPLYNLEGRLSPLFHHIAEQQQALDPSARDPDAWQNVPVVLVAGSLT